MRTQLRYYLFAYWHDPRWKKFAGATVKIWDLAHNLAALGNDVSLFVPRYNIPKTGLPFKIIEIPFVNFPYLRFISFNIILSAVLLKNCFSWKPDVVYVRRMQSIIPMIFAKIFRAIFFFEVNDDPYRQIHHESSRFTFLLRSIVSIKQDEWNLKASDAVSVITEEIKKKSFTSINASWKRN